MIKDYAKPLTLLATAIATAGFFPAAPGMAQGTPATNPGLYENEAYIRGCRETNTTVSVYDNSDLAPINNRIGTLPPNTEVTLTGVLGPGVAQVYLDGGELSSVQPVGWITAAALGPCDTTAATPSNNQACFAADVGLNVRSQPVLNAAILGSYRAGNVIYATANPPIERTEPGGGRVWLEVDYGNRQGWVARTGRFGFGDNVTPIACP